jgi:glycosyltransferase involved in cell wall biosynthesis
VIKKIDYSVIVPTHNSSRFIGKLLDSIPQLTNIEVILIDDHSTPYELKKTTNIFKQYKFNAKKFLVNCGINSAGTARNIGIENSSGKWLIFADSDDYFTADFKELLIKHVHTTSDIIFFRVKGNRVTKRVDTLNKLVTDKILIRAKYHHIVPWGKIIRRELLVNYDIRFSEVIVSNDELFSSKLGFYTTNISFDQLYGYFSFEREGSLTTQVHSKSLHDVRMNEVLKKYTFLSRNLEKSEFNKAELSSFHSVKKAILIGGIIYGLRWYIRLRKVGGKLGVVRILRRKLTR